MFEIKSINELLYPTVTSYGSIKNQFRFVETHRYIDAANAEIKRLQSQPATFDDVPWEPVTLEALGECEDGAYQFKYPSGGIRIWLRNKEFGSWIFVTGARRCSDDMVNSYVWFRKLPIHLYQSAPEKLKRYVVSDPIKQDDGSFSRYLIDTANNTECKIEPLASVEFICNKLNRLEELDKEK